MLCDKLHMVEATRAERIGRRRHKADRIDIIRIEARLAVWQDAAFRLVKRCRYRCCHDAGKPRLMLVLVDPGEPCCRAFEAHGTDGRAHAPVALAFRAECRSIGCPADRTGISLRYPGKREPALVAE